MRKMIGNLLLLLVGAFLLLVATEIEAPHAVVEIESILAGLFTVFGGLGLFGWANVPPEDGGQ